MACNVLGVPHDYGGVRAEAEEQSAESVADLYSERYEGLVRLGYLLTGSRADGEDLAQTAPPARHSLLAASERRPRRPASDESPCSRRIGLLSA